MKTARLIILLSILNVIHAEAHEDPAGDIHPHVSVSSNQFAVTFRSQAPPDWKSEQKRMLFDPMGQRVGGPEVFSPPERSNQVETLPVQLPEERRGLVLADGTNSFLVIPEWSRKHNGKPYIVVIRERKQTEMKPDWGNTNIDIVHETCLTPTHIVLLVSEVDAKDFGLVAINRETGRIENRRSVGIPARIYNFSVNSNLLEFKGDVYIAWVKASKHGYGLILSRWTPDKNTLVSSALPDKTTWNTSLSMARIGERALLAYHYAPEYPGNAKIITVAIDLTKAFTGHGKPRP